LPSRVAAHAPRLRALARRIEVADGWIRVIGSNGDLLRTVAASGAA
jgi:hypothetical protein